MLVVRLDFRESEQDSGNSKDSRHASWHVTYPKDFSWNCRDSMNCSWDCKDSRGSSKDSRDCEDSRNYCTRYSWDSGHDS